MIFPQIKCSWEQKEGGALIGGGAINGKNTVLFFLTKQDRAKELNDFNCIHSYLLFGVVNKNLYVVIILRKYVTLKKVLLFLKELLGVYD